MTKQNKLQTARAAAHLSPATDPMQAMEQVLLNGDLGALSAPERLNYYKSVCESLGLNPLTKPFEYIKLNGRLTLYARKDATDQLRKIYGISIAKPDIQLIEDQILVTVAATDASGRSDSDIGVVSKKDMGGSFANSLMKAITKAKRRVTLSICGLGMLDESEIEAIPSAQAFKEPASGGVEIRNGNAQPSHAPELAETMAERGGIIETMSAVCRQLNELGDATWNRKSLTEFANLVLEAEGKALTDHKADGLQIVLEELQFRLEQLLNPEPETIDAEPVEAEALEAF
jgi:hypothetical protein